MWSATCAPLPVQLASPNHPPWESPFRPEAYTPALRCSHRINSALSHPARHVGSIFLLHIHCGQQNAVAHPHHIQPMHLFPALHPPPRVIHTHPPTHPLTLFLPTLCERPLSLTSTRHTHAIADHAHQYGGDAALQRIKLQQPSSTHAPIHLLSTHSFRPAPPT